MKKILHVLPMNKLSGAEKVALLTCGNLSDYKSIVVCGGDTLKKFFVDEGIEAYSIDFQMKNKLCVVKNLRKIIIEKNIDIIHAHDNIASIYSFIAKKLVAKNIKLISHIHSCYPWLEKNGVKKIVDFIFRRKYDCNIVCGKLVYDFYKKNSKYLKEDKVKIISNAIDVEKIMEQKVNFSVYDKFKIPRNKKVIGFIGRLEKMKGIIPFIEEFSKKKEMFDDCIFLLVGDGSEENNIKKMIREKNLDDKFICVGFQEDVYEFYPIIDIFFLPSLYEGLPLVILEAMAFGKCVVSMNVGSIFEVIENNETGILVDNDIEKFICSIENIKNNDKKIKNLGFKAKEKILKDYSINKYSKKIEAIYGN